jgi:hypothetical protein
MLIRVYSQCDQLDPASIIQRRNANLEVSRFHDYLKKRSRANTGNKHRAPADSTRGQKKALKDRYKLPVSLYKKAIFLNVLLWRL